MRTFDIPDFYRSPLIARVKAVRKAQDVRKRDFSPTLLDFGTVKVLLARHFGFCFGVENAIEIAYKAIAENPGKRIFLLSQMIHNPEVNDDLESRGVRFLMDTGGKIMTPLETLQPEDVVIVPAFGTTLEIEERLAEIGVDVSRYNTTCPFVEKVWKRSASLAAEAYTTVIHGKPTHEETRATFSHAAEKGHALVIKNMDEAQTLATFLRGERPWADFASVFSADRHTEGFDPAHDLQRVGVVNQTTMLATETQAISDVIRAAMPDAAGFANTRDTLCYATNDNQQATLGALAAAEQADLAVVVGGYNSSNTSHLVELCEEKLPTFFIRNELEFLPSGEVQHCDWRTGAIRRTMDPWPEEGASGGTPTILLTSGASCPDASVERVLHRILAHYGGGKPVDEVLKDFEASLAD
jgi:4-hydroxy-3-methylbut-2-enyl diphosphate reductase